MAESLHAKIEREREAALPEAAALAVFRNYAQGKQDQPLSADQKRHLAGLTKHRFADNVCHKVLAIGASRLELTGFAVDNQAVQTFLADLWTKTHLADLQYDIHYATLRDGNHAALLGWRVAEGLDGDGNEIQTGRVVIQRERWWDGASGMFVAYGDDGRPAYAVKEWEVVGESKRSTKRRTVYLPDHIERYVQEGQGWRPFPLEGEDATGIVPWVKKDGSPLGIPIVHFANGSDDDAPYGVSDLDGGVIGLQDQINDLHWDIVAAARMAGYQMYTATGVPAEKNADGSSKPLRVGPGFLLRTDNPNGRFGVLQAGDMSQLIATLRMKVRTVAANTMTPEHDIGGGEWPSGVALLRADMPAVVKAERGARSLGPTWETAMHRGTEIANAYGSERLDEDALITAEFADPARLDALAKAEVEKVELANLAALQLIDDPVLLRLSGLLTEEQITEMTADRTARAAVAVAEF